MKKLNGDEINKYLRNNIEHIYNKVVKSVKKNHLKEENFRVDMAIILNDIFKDLGLKDKVFLEQEYTVYKGRIDSLYGNIIIEYKGPGKINSDINHSSNKNFVEQVKRHINGLAVKNKCDKGKILAAIFDGKNVIYVKYKNNDWEISNVINITLESLSLFIKRVLSLSIEKKALIIENLLKDFDSESLLTKRFIRNIYYCYMNNTKYKKVELLFEQWKQLFREICGYDFDTLDLKIKNLKNVYEINDKVKIEYLIFSIQTYFALIIKFLSIEVLSYLSLKKDNGLNKFDIHNSLKLKNQIEDMEQGGLYKKLGISNFLEGDFFGGYLYFWESDLYELIREMIEIFDSYDYSSINLEPDLAKDLLKNVYHNLFPKELRHNLGEYYTPDWLAQFLIDKMDINFKENNSVLDPTCGSGTFIVLLIKEYINNNRDMEKNELLNKILSNIKGYDLNPLAVISARANYIISLGDLLNERTNNIEIPIYLCDSMLAILEEKKENEDCYIVTTKASNFPIPVKLVKTGEANKMLDLLNNCIKLNCTSEEFLLKIKKTIDVDENELRILEELYNIMDELEKRGLDGIWANVIKNSFAPLFQEKVDYIIGNPPWIVWQSLPENYRTSIQQYWHQYKIFEHKGLTARLGSSHDDLSVLMTYVIMDNFLKDNGKLGFIVNQNIFQSSGGGQGFRKFLIKDTIPIKILEVDDFVNVQPFKDLGADNKTAVFTAIKNAKTSYPVKYNLWKKRGSGKIFADEDYQNVFKSKLIKNELYAKPIKEYNSSWIIGDEEELKLLTKLIATKESKYRARKGVDTSANAIYWIKEKERVNGKILFENSPETSKKIIKHVDDVIEEKLVYPLVRGKDIYKWKYYTPYNIIIPYNEDGEVIPKSDLKVNYENTYNYFYNSAYDFIDILKNRGIVKKHFNCLNNVNEIPEYVLYDIGKYTFSKYKVVWKALANGMISTVISHKNEKLVIPDHNVVMIPLDDEDEAYYLVGILNSNIVTKFVNSYISWFFSTHILENLNIPTFDKDNALHMKVVLLSKQAHIMSMDGFDLKDLELELNEIVEKILLE